MRKGELARAWQREPPKNPRHSPDVAPAFLLQHYQISHHKLRNKMNILIFIVDIFEKGLPGFAMHGPFNLQNLVTHLNTCKNV